MDRKSWSGVVGVVVVLLVLAAWFDIRPIGPWVRHYFFSAKYYAERTVSSPVPQAPPGDANCAAACRNNMRLVESAKAKLRSTRAIGNISWAEIMHEAGLRGAMLTCPCGGEYTLGNLQVAIRCSIGDNGTPAPADDHIYR